jgi:UDP-N-acetylmuramate dehydrogenase
MKVKLNHSLKNNNTFGVESRAKMYIEPETQDELRDILVNREQDEKLLVLGGGSNILLTKDFDGLVIRPRFSGISIIQETADEVYIRSEAGVVWDELVEYLVSRQLSGIENLSLIPGNVGAAPIQNIGAYGQELSQVFYCLEGFMIAGGKRKEFDKDECRFGYRDSIFKSILKNKFIITSVTFKLSKNFTPNLSYAALREEIENSGIQELTPAIVRNAVIGIRTRKLPDPKVLGNAGSFFKNPEIEPEQFGQLQKEFPDVKEFKSGNKIKLYAGWLIEKSGWKGVRIGNVGSYEGQALVIVNYGGAGGSEILEFARNIKRSVKEMFDIELKEEVNII